MTHITSENLEVSYTYYSDKGDYYQPPHTEVEIDSIFYKDTDVTSLILEVAQDYVEDLTERLEQMNK